MIKWLLDEFLLNIPYDCMNFISYASYRNTLRKKVKFWPKIKIPLALDIKNWGFQLKMVGGGSRDKKKQKEIETLTIDRWLLTVDQAVDRFVEAGDLKRLLRFIFSTVRLHSLKTLHIPVSRDQFGQDFGPISGLGVDFEMFLRPGFRIWT